MSFEPRLIRPEDDGPDNPPMPSPALQEYSPAIPSPALQNDELPAELSALAEQLADDARHLTECYPAAVPARPGALGARTSHRRVRPKVAAAVALVALGVWGAGEQLVPRARPTVTPRWAPVPAVRPVSNDDSAPAGLIFPASHFDKLSPSAREGLLDLWEDGAVAISSISI